MNDSKIIKYSTKSVSSYVLDLKNNNANNNSRVEEVAQLENHNNMKIINRMCDSCDFEFQISKKLSTQPLDPLNIFFEKYYADLIENNDNFRDDVKRYGTMELKKVIVIIKEN